MGLAKIAKHYRKNKQQVKPIKLGWREKIVVFFRKVL